MVLIVNTKAILCLKILLFEYFVHVYTAYCSHASLPPPFRALAPTNIFLLSPPIS